MPSSLRPRDHEEIVLAALRDAIEKLTEEEKLLLRHWIMDGMTLEQIARVLGITRKTAAGCIGKLRRRMLWLIKVELGNRLQLSQTALESLLKNVESKVDASLSNPLLPGDDLKSPEA